VANGNSHAKNQVDLINRFGKDTRVLQQTNGRTENSEILYGETTYKKTSNHTKSQQRQASKQAVALIKNLTNADNDNSMNMSTKMEMSQVNKQYRQYRHVVVKMPASARSQANSIHKDIPLD